MSREKKMEEAQIGDLVSVHYTGKLTNGEVFDSSKDRDPLKFTLGDKELLGGFEERRPLAGFELFYGYRNPHGGFLLNYPFIGREHAVQIDYRYKYKKFTWKDSTRPHNGPDGSTSASRS